MFCCPGAKQEAGSRNFLRSLLEHPHAENNKETIKNNFYLDYTQLSVTHKVRDDGTAPCLPVSASGCKMWFSWSSRKIGISHSVFLLGSILSRFDKSAGFDAE